MYERFLQSPRLPAGAVLEHLLIRKGISPQDLAMRTDLPLQHISEFISGLRRISAEAALRIGTALSLIPVGLLYMLQCNHDLYLVTCEESSTPDMTKIRKSFFWDTDISLINWQLNAYSVVKRIFEYGDETAIKEIIRFYGADRVRELLLSITDSRFAERRQYHIKQYLE